MELVVPTVLGPSESFLQLWLARRHTLSKMNALPVETRFMNGGMGVFKAQEGFLVEQRDTVSGTEGGFLKDRAHLLYAASGLPWDVSKCLPSAVSTMRGIGDEG